MKSLNYKILMCVIIAFLFFASNTAAQNEMPRADGEQRQEFKQPRRPNLLAELDLKAEQIQQIRRINADKKPLLREAQFKFREANRQLDLAIYADNTDEAEIQARLKELQTAQAEVHKIRVSIEYEVRKLLTPEQLMRFREIRQKYAAQPENFQRKRKNSPPGMPNQKPFYRQRRPKTNF